MCVWLVVQHLVLPLYYCVCSLPRFLIQMWVPSERYRYRFQYRISRSYIVWHLMRVCVRDLYLSFVQSHTRAAACAAHRT